MANKLPLDSSYDLEQQFILRMTDPVAAANLAADIESGVSFKDNFTVEFKPDMRHSIVRYNGQVYQGCLMDLPCVIESLKTTDKQTFYKTADICQMMVCTQGEDGGPLRGTAAYLDDRARSWSNSFDASRENRVFQYLHGITPPLKNVLRRRFRKSRQKRLVDMPKIEKEVKQLLRADLQAVGVKWEVIWSDPPSSSSANNPLEPDSGANTGDGDRIDSGLASSVTGRQAAADDDEVVEEEEDERTRAYAIDRRDVFGELSSSSGDSSGDSSPAASDDENTRSGSKQPLSIANRPVSGRTMLSSSQLPDDGSHAVASYDHASGLGALKDQLAAELLLSDSGDEATPGNAESPNPERASGEDALEEALEVDLQASVAAELAAHNVPIPSLDASSVDVDLDDEDDMMVVHRGGELLDEDDDNLMGCLPSSGLSTEDTIDYNGQ